MEFTELTEKLLKRFKDVPNVDQDDVNDWIEMSMLEHGYNKDQDVPSTDVVLVLLFAEADGALQISLRTSHYFQWKDAEESVDKSMVTDKYRTLSDKLFEKYYRKRAETSNERRSGFSIMTRADRPRRR